MLKTGHTSLDSSLSERKPVELVVVVVGCFAHKRASNLPFPADLGVSVINKEDVHGYA